MPSPPTLQAEIGGMVCRFLADLAGPGTAETQQFAAALHQADSELDGLLVETSLASRAQEVGVRLSLALEVERLKEQAKAEVGAGPRLMKSTGVEDPFEGVEETAEGGAASESEGETLKEAYGRAMEDFVHRQVGCTVCRFRARRKRKTGAQSIILVLNHFVFRLFVGACLLRLLYIYQLCSFTYSKTCS